MKILVPTSDNYAHLIEPYYILLNKYWPNNEVVFLGFNSKKYTLSYNHIPYLPENCSFVSLGKQEHFGKEWTTPLIPYINNIDDEYFAVIMEDMVVVGNVDLQKIKLLEDEIRSAQADKAILDSHLRHLCEPYKQGIVKIKQNVGYGQTTLHPSIWRKDYFLKYLKPGLSAWEFETKNMYDAMNDGANIIFQEGVDDIYKSMNIYDKGKAVPRWDSKDVWGCASHTHISDEDKNLVLGYINE